MSDIPLGLCQCGCGRPTNPASSTNARLGLVKGQPQRYLRGHARRKYPHAAMCTVDGCDRPPEARGLCHSHFEWARRHGQTPTGRILDTDLDRFMAKVKILPSGHWIWTAATAAEGRYGVATLRGKSQPAHRVAWQLFRGQIPDGLVVEHLCRRTLCVAVEHLQLATQQTNVLRGDAPSAANAAKTHCDWGHEFTVENTKEPASGSCRICVACESSERRRAAARERTRRYRARKAAAAGAA